MIGDVIAIVELIWTLGTEIQTRIESLEQTVEDLKLLNANLRVLSTILKDHANDDLWNNYKEELKTILYVLENIKIACIKCAKALGLDIAGAKIVPQKIDARGKRFTKTMKPLWTFLCINDHSTEIQQKAEQLQKVCNTVSLMLNNSRTQQKRTSIEGTVESKAVLRSTIVPGDSVDLDFKTQFAGIDQMVGNLLAECKELRRRLQEATMSPDNSAFYEYQDKNPEIVSFWRDRFQSGGPSLSSLRYEVRKPLFCSLSPLVLTLLLHISSLLL